MHGSMARHEACLGKCPRLLIRLQPLEFCTCMSIPVWLRRKAGEVVKADFAVRVNGVPFVVCSQFRPVGRSSHLVPRLVIRNDNVQVRVDLTVDQLIAEDSIKPSKPKIIGRPRPCRICCRDQGKQRSQDPLFVYRSPGKAGTDISSPAPVTAVLLIPRNKRPLGHGERVEPCSFRFFSTAASV